MTQLHCQQRKWRIGGFPLPFVQTSGTSRRAAPWPQHLSRPPGHLSFSFLLLSTYSSLLRCVSPGDEQSHRLAKRVSNSTAVRPNSIIAKLLKCPIIEAADVALISQDTAPGVRASGAHLTRCPSPLSNFFSPFFNLGVWKRKANLDQSIKKKVTALRLCYRLRLSKSFCGVIIQTCRFYELMTVKMCACSAH